ncbi:MULTISPECIES: DUF1778 domain-containing protein [Candidatus Regiella]|uniref:CopG family transcriptional regulator n=1 Tax=Candidatus Regiella insecticola TaxID=138073 RepID=A0A6L2ZM50_9ENTR|nr:DUF1778 domain-containing protein [Candidatus Regiella insecticola]GFN45385.1 copG family transcriptional regulator [Candidatus Regiella insecticola]
MYRTAPINMRVKPSQHALLTKAAALLHKDRSAFILDVACREAENILLDQRLFCLNEEKFKAFEAALVTPLASNAKLKALLTELSPWEK